MQNKGIYYSKLIRVFAFITIGLSIILLLLVILSFANIEQRDNHMLNSILNTQINSIDSALNYTTETINRFTYDPNILEWINAETSTPDYYFNALKIYQMLREERAFQNYMDIDIAITSPDTESFVISPSGTMTKKQFGEESTTELNGPAIYPIFDDNSIKSLLLVTPRTVDNGNLLFLSSFKLPEEILTSTYFYLAVIDENRNQVFSTNKDFEEAITPKLNTNLTSFKVKGYQCEVRSYPNYGFSLVFGYGNTIKGIPIILLSLLFLIALSSAILVFSKITKNLYKPVDEVVTYLRHEEGEEKDEFAIIKDHCNKIEYLSKELESAFNEQYMLKEQQKYRAFLRGIPTSIAENDKTSTFIVAVAIVNVETNNISGIFAHLDTFSKSTPHLHFVRTEPNSAVLIQKADTEKAATEAIMGMLTKFISSFEGDLDANFAVAKPVLGYKNITSAYLEAKEIVQFRYKLSKKTILTLEDIQGKESKLYFPFSEENKLIAMLLAGKEEALLLFDDLIEINLKRALLPNELKNFSKMMLGIANRLFQELKEEPMDMLGQDIPWNTLYTQDDAITTLDSVRAIFSEVINFRREAETANDNNMINAMKDYINEHYMENIMLIDLSEAFNLTPKYCSSLFSQFSTDNFKTYLNTLRIQKACEILKKDPNIKISDLSQKTGFTSSNTFIRVFSKHVGVTPKTYAQEIVNKIDKSFNL